MKVFLLIREEVSHPQNLLPHLPTMSWDHFLIFVTEDKESSGDPQKPFRLRAQPFHQNPPL
jgi:hypothetical protein